MRRAIETWLSGVAIEAAGLRGRLAERATRRMRRDWRDDTGQTPTEYLMIVGLMAAVIVVVFVTFFWPQFKDAASQWVTKVHDAILGQGIQ
jgi:Flp pilus assembly pilin Flp